MTLRRQLFGAISVVFLLILIGLLGLSVRGTRNYLEQQLGSHAQDAATTLSISLAPSLAKPDMVLADLQLSSVFDRGYFQRIAVLNTTGATLVVKSLPVKIDDVPLWFSSLFPLRAPTGEAFITSGWRQLGKVLVASQPAFAYQYLWTTATEIALWMGLAYAAALALTHLLLRVILNPLRAIEHTAKAVQERRFEQIPKEPRARELARVVRAMNTMSRRISEMFDAEAAKVEGFRRLAFEDDVTGLDNRKAFDLRFGELLEGHDHIASGVVAVLEVDGLKAYNTGSSYREGNQLLTALADASRQTLGKQGTILGRVGGASFGYVIANLPFAQASTLVHQLHHNLVAVVERLDTAKAISFSLGGVYFRGGDQRGQIMAKADLAVEAARQSGRNQLQLLPQESGDQDALGSLGWRDLLRGALSQGLWRLLAQPVISFGREGQPGAAMNRVMHAEVMVRLTDLQGKLVPAGKFIPMAIRHQMMPEVDTAVVTLVIRRLNARPAAAQLVVASAAPLGLPPAPVPTMPRMAINISMQSLQSPTFLSWLSRELQALGARASGLAFELSRFGCAQDIELARRFAALVRRNGAQFGIDRFGLDPHSLQTLRLLPPDYVKLDSALVEEASADVATTDLVNSIVNLARSLDVVVIAQGVETAEQAEALKATHDAGQGYYFGVPTEMDD